jgi:NAD(P)H-dependent FMN reductase
MSESIRIGVILGSVREGRQGERVARWVLGHAPAAGVEAELIDLLAWPLPFYTYAEHPRAIEGHYRDELPRRWVAEVGRFDGYVWVTPEYNHGFSCVLKNAIDYVSRGWDKKPIAICSYGGASGGIRAAEQLRLVASVLGVAVPEEVNVPFVTRAFGPDGKPSDAALERRAQAMWSALAWWARTLTAARERG